MPEFDPNARLDTSQIDDRRGRSMGGIPGGGLTVGGGAIGLILTVLAVLFGGDVTGGGGGGTGAGTYGDLRNQATDGQVPGGGTLAQNCQTGADAAARDDCRMVAFVNSIQAFWTSEFANRGGNYRPSQTQFFERSTQTGCGPATSQVGPFYCPRDEKVYIDLGFLNELRSKFGVRGGSFAHAYVLAHEYCHHIQDLLGVLERAQDGDTGPQSAAVRVELQADCLAGVWARHATATGIITSLSEQDIRDGLDAAAAVGDDRIQKTTQGRVNKESWTHGSSEQRQRWFMTGYQTGDMMACDTFRGNV